MSILCGDFLELNVSLAAFYSCVACVLLAYLYVHTLLQLALWQPDIMYGTKLFQWSEKTGYTVSDVVMTVCHRAHSYEILCVCMCSYADSCHPTGYPIFLISCSNTLLTSYTCEFTVETLITILFLIDI